jgi:hypothetical protein
VKNSNDLICIEPNIGFVAGTLVHTNNGLVPIEQLKIGDKVLSRAENDPEGDLIYKPVTETRQFQSKTLHFLRMGITGGTDQASVSGVITTPNHPFWVKNYGWKRADLLRMGDTVLLANGLDATVFEWGPIFATDTPNVGWVPVFYEIHGFHENGFLIDLRNNSINSDLFDVKSRVIYGDVAGDYRFKSVEESLYISDVYNITVAETHTYFVNYYGVWVHNKP